MPAFMTNPQQPYLVTRPYWHGSLTDAPGFDKRDGAKAPPPHQRSVSPDMRPAAAARPGEASGDYLTQVSHMQRVPSSKAEVFVLRNFLSAEECGALIALIDAQRRPSTIANHDGAKDFRTSETCDLDPDNPVVAALDAKLAMLSGIEPAHGEQLQGQRYSIGQEFKAHTDYFEPQHEDYQTYCAVAGQRTWTFMIYLNDVEAGGATRFKILDKTFKPEQGKVLAWNNRHPDGRLNIATLHHATKVRKGMKYVVTRWYRERPWR